MRNKTKSVVLSRLVAAKVASLSRRQNVPISDRSSTSMRSMPRKIESSATSRHEELSIHHTPMVWPRYKHDTEVKEKSHQAKFIAKKEQNLFNKLAG